MLFMLLLLLSSAGCFTPKLFYATYIQLSYFKRLSWFYLTVRSHNDNCLKIDLFLEKLKLVYVLCLSLLCCLALRSSAGKGADLLALLCVVFTFCHFPICVQGQIWYLFVSISDLCVYEKVNVMFSVQI